ncbi:hypothetical protein M406DRAFT_339379 [Cryphonectria parasitica EP155]|uniref:Transcription initiation factor TFIID subunit 4 n=1 Tax=Cryphonectria parasitica (strain ATCC 38755 / EP155) TaxID=660469 RepID=A0A9P4Y432_CRYP1|nr:uncharacterized protein M406DRAFT_339379 [Cryphonectria parasitica EP155]KAF3766094.1 hypothetical protein M406DRAFT_339379 [Cryphonectria parasitica EP155]
MASGTPRPPPGGATPFNAPNAQNAPNTQSQSQPASPYSVTSPRYAGSPNIPATTAPATPHIVPSPATPGVAPGTPGAGPQQHYTTQAFAPPVSASAPNTPGAMGPPSGRPQREYEYDVTDSLLGTGVNIRDEENALAEYYAGSFGQDARTGLPSNAPGNRSSFYGTGFASQPGAATTATQKEFEFAEAERAWNESAARLSATRAIEHNDPFLNYANLHARMEKMAASHGLELNLDNKNSTQAHVQKSRGANEYPGQGGPKLTISTKTSPDGALVHINGTVLPTDSFLIDQLALLSLGTRQRLRGLVEECDKLATHRQQSSHGVIPMSWADDGIPLELAGLYDPKDAERSGNLAPLNPLSQYLRDYAYAERAAEEERLRKRQKRLQEEGGTQTGTRTGAATPTTPGSVAPEPEKAPTKKEQKKIAAQKHDASAESVNMTTMKFLGGGKKKYSWMTGGAGSGPKTPSRAAVGAPGTPQSSATPKAPENTNLTPEPRTKMGTWREYGEKGKNIQIRDWAEVLERDGKEALALQYAYLKWKRD